MNGAMYCDKKDEQSREIIGLDDSSLENMNDARILVIGAGGMGNNAVNRLSKLGVQGASTVAINTDKQHLLSVSAGQKILIGRGVTKGLGAGGYPDKGRQAAQESINELKHIVQGNDLVFVIAGMGGGTGTGSAPFVAKLAKTINPETIVIGVVTMPFKIEGARLGKAEEGIFKLRDACDTVIVIENDKLLEVAGDLSLQQAFEVADQIIVTMIKGITETISTPSIVNLDFADVKSVMTNGGVAVIGIGESQSASKAREAVEEAMSNPLLDVDYKGATGALVHIAGGPDMRLGEVTEIGDFVSRHLDTSASTIWGARVDESLEGKIRVITIITGVQSPYVMGKTVSTPKQDDMEKSTESFNEELGIKVAF